MSFEFCPSPLTYNTVMDVGIATLLQIYSQVVSLRSLGLSLKSGYRTTIQIVFL